MDGAVPLNANTAYVFSFVLDSHSYQPITPEAVWAGTGFLDLAVRPVPEPATLILAFWGLGYLASRPRRRVL